MLSSFSKHQPESFGAPGSCQHRLWTRVERKTKSSSRSEGSFRSSLAPEDSFHVMAPYYLTFSLSVFLTLTCFQNLAHKKLSLIFEAVGKKVFISGSQDNPSTALPIEPSLFLLLSQQLLSMSAVAPSRGSAAHGATWV